MYYTKNSSSIQAILFIEIEGSKSLGFQVEQEESFLLPSVFFASVVLNLSNKRSSQG